MLGILHCKNYTMMDSIIYISAIIDVWKRIHKSIHRIQRSSYWWDKTTVDIVEIKPAELWGMGR